jgi:predicted RNA binding protein YcfA (HicA-like mRNA interferase family)
MSQWGSCKAKLLYRALLNRGWTLKREAKGSHRILQREGYSNFVFSFHDGEEIGPRMLSRIAKQTGLEPNDL